MPFQLMNTDTHYLELFLKRGWKYLKVGVTGVLLFVVM